MAQVISSGPAVKGKSKRPARQRTLSYNARVGALHVRDEKGEKGYWLDELAHDFGPGVRCFRLTKMLPDGGGPREYDVILTPKGDDCECLGWQRWRKCRHVAALRCLRGRGSL